MASSSILLVDEYFEHGDPRFVAELLRCTDAEARLKAFGTRWFSDRRPFARAALLSFIDDGCDRPGQRPLVKDLFKAAETASDDELMLHFMVAFDRLVQRKVVREHVRQVVDGNLVPLPRWRRTWVAKDQDQDGRTRFSVRTRMYLCRRAYRYFRRIGYREPDRYVALMEQALLLYSEQDVAAPDNLLDRWSLFHVLYWGSDAGLRRPRAIRLAPDKHLSDLTPAPAFAEAWSKADRFSELMALLCQARNGYVRGWLIQFLSLHHRQRLAAIEVDVLWPLLTHPELDVQTFAASLVPNLTGLQQLSVERWLALATVDNEEALPALVALLEKHVAPRRLSLADCISLATQGKAPAARLGLGLARQRTVTEYDLPALVPLSDARAHDVRAQGLQWLAGLLAEYPRVLIVRELLDSLHSEVRTVALQLLEATSQYAADERLLLSMLESPHADVRDALIRRLERFVTEMPPLHIQHLWARVLLNVRNGSHTKRWALRQLTEHVLANPAHADRLLPLFAVALRSVRESERRAALAAIARCVYARPEMAETIQRFVPELSLSGLT